MVNQGPFNPETAGSSPAQPTIFKALRLTQGFSIDKYSMIPFKQYITELSKPSEIDPVKAALRNFRSEAGEDDFLSAYSDFGFWATSPVAPWRDTKVAIRAQIKTALEKYGFKLIGSGAKGAAFSHKNYPYIIKLFSYDDGYMRYIKFANQNPNNRYVPKFKGQPTKIFGEIYYVRVEKLEEIPPKNPKIITLMQSFDLITRMLQRYGHLNAEAKSLKPNKDMMALCNFMYKTPSTVAPDLHAGNFMMRPNGDIVIIDPLIGD